METNMKNRSNPTAMASTTFIMPRQTGNVCQATSTDSCGDVAAASLEPSGSSAGGAEEHGNGGTTTSSSHSLQKPVAFHSLTKEKMQQGLESFPVRLHYMLNEVEKDGLSLVCSWQPHGRCKSHSEFMGRAWVCVCVCVYDSEAFANINLSLFCIGFRVHNRALFQENIIGRYVIATVLCWCCLLCSLVVLCSELSDMKAICLTPLLSRAVSYFAIE